MVSRFVENSKKERKIEWYTIPLNDTTNYYTILRVKWQEKTGKNQYFYSSTAVFSYEKIMVKGKKGVERERQKEILDNTPFLGYNKS